MFFFFSAANVLVILAGQKDKFKENTQWLPKITKNILRGVRAARAVSTIRTAGLHAEASYKAWAERHFWERR
jgi:hypothetical protein